jgi:DNA-binding NarL/FixJ family response regulator
MNPQKAKVLIVDDHPMLREGLALRINREPDLLACCEADSAESAFASCEECSHDLALVDLRLADSSGLTLIRQLRQKYPDMPILVVSMYDESVYAERALQAGAQGYIMKQEATETLIQAIRLVLGGELYVSDKLRSYLIRLLIGGGDEKASLTRLTSSEFDVFSLLGMGMSARQIAEQLKRSTKTIESHCANIKKKLGLQSGRELNQYAIDWQRSEKESMSIKDA